MDNNKPQTIETIEIPVQLLEGILINQYTMQDDILAIRLALETHKFHISDKNDRDVANVGWKKKAQAEIAQLKTILKNNDQGL